MFDAGDAAGSEGGAVHEEGVELDAAFAGEEGAATGVEGGVVFEDGDGGFDGVGGAAAVFENGVAGGEGVGDAALVVFGHLRWDGPGAAVDEQDGSAGLHGHSTGYREWALLGAGLLLWALFDEAKAGAPHLTSRQVQRTGWRRVVAGFREGLERARTVFRTAKLFWKFMREKRPDTRPQGTIPVVRMTREGLLAAPERTLWRLGHSTVLMKLSGGFFLTDPVFAERASPVPFAGPKRFHAPPISIRELPAIKAVVISHDHYDHLDERAIRKLRKKTELFIAPRGVGAILRGWGVKAEQIRELEWWQEMEVGGVRLASTPTQHFSGRSLWNRNQTLFCSWVVMDGDFRVFYGGDSGYFDGFAQIGQKYGPFDVTLVENGAYNERWSTIHMQPEETMRAFGDLRGKWLLPIHNGTFDLAFHPWWEPMERVQALAGRDGILVCTPRFGEPARMDAMSAGDCWWRGVDGSELARVPRVASQQVSGTEVSG